MVAYVGVMMTTLVLAALYVLSSLALLSAAENNVRDLHLPWLVVHPLVETGLMLFLGYAAVVLARYDYHGYTIPVVFAMFIIFCECRLLHELEDPRGSGILTYLWVVVMGNFQRLGTTDPEDAKQLLEGWHDAGQGYPRVQPQPEYPHGYSQVYSQGMRVPRSKTSWAAPPPPSGPPPPPPAPYNAFS
ncbi:unnamed protein product [Darwinula stevensoni]|uniref:Uncharacterized protein n=1 Tax=Darwinula stevensoni TaxID=69355 RepID=A0A7R9FRU0_9CRUS|nr:unnamed protein product [Darwinula stevensoni]CAG0902105.1 unnamed protein product [Darwinula stevensoni]